jgi:CHRD domain-containing protein
MLKNKTGRRLLAALGGASMLLGVGTTGAAVARELRAVLNGDNLTPAGDTDGWGRVAIVVDGTLNRLCADVEVRSLGEVTEVAIRRTADNGPVVALQAPDDNDSNDCDSIGDELADQIQANPSGFYVLVKTRDFPEGAVRGDIVPS